MYDLGEECNWRISHGFCYLLEKCSTYLIYEFPELYSYKPDNYDDYWFPYGDWTRRKEILKEIINEMPPVDYIRLKLDL